jgi:signal transduction histidine kinase
MDAQVPPLPPHRRHIDLHLRQHGDTVVLRVADHAGGIDPVLLPRIFEPFVVANPSSSGMGLSICTGIVKDMGGSLVAANQGDGSVFEIRLPCVGPADGLAGSRDKTLRWNRLPA